jgi:hypothetical protein
MPNFIHSLDASSIHELTNFIHNLKIGEIQNELEELKKRATLGGSLEGVETYLIEKYTYNSDEPEDNLKKDNTYMDSTLVKNHELIKVAAFNQNIPLYTIHDCFATTPNNM